MLGITSDMFKFLAGRVDSEKRDPYRVNRLCGNCVASYSDVWPYGTPAPHYSECPRCGCKRGFVTP